jgi:undecaprenyl diphosphate synthase
MMQSSLHIAIIMDGNGRWAVRRGLPRTAGHCAGAEALRGAVEAAPELGIRILTVYAFSSDNWKRPLDEVDALMSLLAHHLESETPRCIESGVRMEAIGRRDRLPRDLRESIEQTEQRTRFGDRLLLRIAIDYSARDSILSAADANSRAAFEAALAASPTVDLLIRTGGEQRLSDFLLWECAYAELIFVPMLWPDFTAEDLRRAVQEFTSRERRFGALPNSAATPALAIARERWLR